MEILYTTLPLQVQYIDNNCKFTRVLHSGDYSWGDYRALDGVALYLQFTTCYVHFWDSVCSSTHATILMCRIIIMQLNLDRTIPVDSGDTRGEDLL